MMSFFIQDNHSCIYCLHEDGVYPDACNPKPRPKTLSSQRVQPAQSVFLITVYNDVQAVGQNALNIALQYIKYY